MENCRKSHERCHQQKDRFKPHRLIEIPTTMDVSHLKVVETTTLEAEVQWCALSYCWGGPQPMQTTQLNFDQQKRQRRLEVRLLPKTFLDAVLVASRLGIPYLWIDSLCIMQGDNDDLLVELATMPSIYKNAAVTFVAARTASSEEGFLCTRMKDNRYNGYAGAVRLRCTTGKDPPAYFVSYFPYNYWPASDPLDHRCWTLQEVLLSHRSIRFGSDGIEWTCPSLPSGTRPDKYSLDRSAKGLFQASPYPRPDWRSILEIYCNRQISHTSDRLLALSAIAADFGQQRGYHYLAGLWAEEAPETLLWYILDYDNTRTLRFNHTRRASPYRAPSWSWASVDAQDQSAEFVFPPIANQITKFEMADQVSVINCSVDHVDSRLPFGNVRSGRITVIAQSARAILRKDTSFAFYMSQTNADSSFRFDEVLWDCPEEDFAGWNREAEWEMHLLYLSRCIPGISLVSLLVVRRLPGEADHYQRVGVYESREDITTDITLVSAKQFVLV